MDFFRRTAGHPTNLGIFPGTFNPVTVAHVALANAALQWVDEVVFVVPREFPHKTWSGASFDDRVQLLITALGGEPHFSIGSTARGLFVEIAAECRQAYGADARLSFLCGADAAERIASWDYGEPEAFARMLEEFDLLVADRAGAFELPRCRRLQLAGDYAHISATEVRERIARGEEWQHLVPPAVREQVGRIYTA